MRKLGSEEAVNCWSRAYPPMPQTQFRASTPSRRERPALYFPRRLCGTGARSPERPLALGHLKTRASRQALEQASTAAPAGDSQSLRAPSIDRAAMGAGSEHHYQAGGLTKAKARMGVGRVPIRSRVDEVF